MKKLILTIFLLKNMFHHFLIGVLVKSFIHFTVIIDLHTVFYKSLEEVIYRNEIYRKCYCKLLWNWLMVFFSKTIFNVKIWIRTILTVKIWIFPAGLIVTVKNHFELRTINHFQGKRPSTNFTVTYSTLIYCKNGKFWARFIIGIPNFVKFPWYLGKFFTKNQNLE